jgi:hypothetical protein
MSFVLFLSLLLSAVPVTKAQAADPPIDLEMLAVEIMVKAFQVNDYETVELLFDKLSLENKKKFLQEAVEMIVTDFESPIDGTLVDVMYYGLLQLFSEIIDESGEPYCTTFSSFIDLKGQQTQLLGRLTASLFERQEQQTRARAGRR